MTESAPTNPPASRARELHELEQRPMSYPDDFRTRIANLMNELEIELAKVDPGEMVAREILLDEFIGRLSRVWWGSGRLQIAGSSAAPAQSWSWRDAYESAREDLLDWKARAQRAEAALSARGPAGLGKDI